MQELTYVIFVWGMQTYLVFLFFHYQDIHALILGKAITGIPAFAN